MKKFFSLPILALVIILLCVNSHAQDDYFEDVVDSSIDDMMDQTPLIIFSTSSVILPIVSVNYGIVTPFFHKDAEPNDIFSTNSLNVRLGMATMRPLRSDPDSVVFRHSQSLFSFTSYNRKLGSYDTESENITANGWSFGLESGGGYGLKSGDHDFLYFNSISGLTWTHLTFKEMKADTIVPLSSNLESFTGQARFGNSFEANIAVYPIENLGITVGYERAMIFPRHMFWYWAGSSILQSIANGLGDWFAKEIIKKNPVAGAMMHFVLTNAINYGFYELRKGAMNWPFDTAHPLLYDSFKVGLGLKF